MQSVKCGNACEENRARILSLPFVTIRSERLARTSTFVRHRTLRVAQWFVCCLPQGCKQGCLPNIRGVVIRRVTKLKGWTVWGLNPGGRKTKYFYIFRKKKVQTGSEGALLLK